MMIWTLNQGCPTFRHPRPTFAWEILSPAKIYLNLYKVNVFLIKFMRKICVWSHTYTTVLPTIIVKQNCLVIFYLWEKYVFWAALMRKIFIWDRAYEKNICLRPRLWETYLSRAALMRKIFVSDSAYKKNMYLEPHIHYSHIKDNC